MDTTMVLQKSQPRSEAIRNMAQRIRSQLRSVRKQQEIPVEKMQEIREKLAQLRSQETRLEQDLIRLLKQAHGLEPQNECGPERSASSLLLPGDLAVI